MKPLNLRAGRSLKAPYICSTRGLSQRQTQWQSQRQTQWQTQTERVKRHLIVQDGIHKHGHAVLCQNLQICFYAREMTSIKGTLTLGEILSQRERIANEMQVEMDYHHHHHHHHDLVAIIKIIVIIITIIAIIIVIIIIIIIIIITIIIIIIIIIITITSSSKNCKWVRCEVERVD